MENLKKIANLLWYKFILRLLDDESSIKSIFGLVVKCLLMLLVVAPPIMTKYFILQTTLTKVDLWVVLATFAVQFSNYIYDKLHTQSSANKHANAHADKIAIKEEKIMDYIVKRNRQKKGKAAAIDEKFIETILVYIRSKVAYTLKDHMETRINATLLAFTDDTGQYMKIISRAETHRKSKTPRKTTELVANDAIKSRCHKVIHNFKPNGKPYGSGFSPNPSNYRSILAIPIILDLTDEGCGPSCLGVLTLDSKTPYDFYSKDDLLVNQIMPVITLILGEIRDQLPHVQCN